MFPIVAYVISLIIKRMDNFWKYFWIATYALCFISIQINFHFENKYELALDRKMLPVKLKTLSKIRDVADGRPFSSYHYVPDIYDFTYQYLYLVDGFKGKDMPKEFSYEPNVTEYVVQKKDLINKLTAGENIDQNTQANEPEVIFYIVEKPENQEFLDQWWGRQRYSKILYEEEMSDTVKLYAAEP